mmetsp:Transcript_5854/g.19937  ORF Transcript_5854/g.19937 Transcript_5854/m.19937 type:complete len:558 (-) Transcript_5854:90-1763(-)
MGPTWRNPSRNPGESMESDEEATSHPLSNNKSTSSRSLMDFTIPAIDSIRDAMSTGGVGGALNRTWEIGTQPYPYGKPSFRDTSSRSILVSSRSMLSRSAGGSSVDNTTSRSLCGPYSDAGFESMQGGAISAELRNSFKSTHTDEEMIPRRVEGFIRMIARAEARGDKEMLRRLEKRGREELQFALAHASGAGGGSAGAAALARALAQARATIAQRDSHIEEENPGGGATPPAVLLRVPTEKIEEEGEEQPLSCMEKLEDEMVLAIEWLFTVMKPQPLGAPRRRPVAWLSSLCLASTYFFMAGQWQAYLLNITDPEVSPSDYEQLKSTMGPRPMIDLVNFRAPYGGGFGSQFGTGYVELWGGWTNKAFQEPSRWFTSTMVHFSWGHVLGNVVFNLTLLLLLESKYGWWRLLILWWSAGLAGNFLAVAVDGSCHVVAGASGAVFGLFGVYMADLMLYRKSLNYPFFRGLAGLAFVVYFIYSLADAGQRETFSWPTHVGGFIAGLFGPGMLFLDFTCEGKVLVELPSVARHHLVLIERVVVPLCALVSNLVFFLFLPLY